MFGGFERPEALCFTGNSQNVFSKTSCFYAPIWRKMRWHAGNSSKRAPTRMPAHFPPNRSVKTGGFGKHALRILRKTRDFGALKATKHRFKRCLVLISAGALGEAS